MSVKKRAKSAGMSSHRAAPLSKSGRKLNSKELKKSQLEMVGKSNSITYDDIFESFNYGDRARE